MPQQDKTAKSAKQAATTRYFYFIYFACHDLPIHGGGCGGMLQQAVVS